MPASMTIARVASSPKVAGRSRLIPASGPTPGSTPTSVPTRQPTKPYQSTLGESATLKPRSRFWKVSSTSEPEGTARQRHPQESVEQVERAPGDGHRQHDRRDDAPPLEHEEQEEEHDGDGEPVAEVVEPPRRERARAEDGDGVTPFVPSDIGEATAPRAQHRQGDAEEDEQQREDDGHVGGARTVQRTQRKPPALPERDQSDEH